MNSELFGDNIFISLVFSLRYDSFYAAYSRFFKKSPFFNKKSNVHPKANKFQLQRRLKILLKLPEKTRIESCRCCKLLSPGFIWWPKTSFFRKRDYWEIKMSYIVQPANMTQSYHSNAIADDYFCGWIFCLCVILARWGGWRKFVNYRKTVWRAHAVLSCHIKWGEREREEQQVYKYKYELTRMRTRL